MARLIQLEKGNRYYIAETVQDLFGGIVVVLRWGSLKTEWERRKNIPVSSHEEAALIIAAVIRKKEKRGYVPAYTSGSTR